VPELKTRTRQENTAQAGKRSGRSVSWSIQYLTILELILRGSSVDNFVPGKLTELGIGYEQLREVNPRIIHASVSGKWICLTHTFAITQCSSTSKVTAMVDQMLNVLDTT
jgi:hypothetical protein